MKKTFYSIIFLILSLTIQAKTQTLVKFDKRNELKYTTKITGEADVDSPFYRKYKSVQTKINLLVDFPEAVIEHSAIDDKREIEFQKKYSTTQFGLRKTPIKEKANELLILAGDSNVFGIGCNDDETLTYHLDRLLPQTRVINMGFAGTAGNSFLYFLQHYQLSEVIPSLSDKSLRASLFYDFSDYLIERMIGGKNFISWGWMQPAYEIRGQELVYTGSFNERWITKFYRLINFIDPGKVIFPNLPRINHHHYELVARIFLEIKKQFLLQTNAKNRFSVLIHPFTLNENNRPVVKKVEQELNKLGIETIRFDEERALQHNSIYPRDLHMKPDGQEFYAGLIAEKMKSDSYQFVPASK